MIELIEYTGNTSTWDYFIDRTINGTVFHKLGFLSYHTDRDFHPMHLMLIQKTHEIGCVSFDIDLSGDKGEARSPYGGSYGWICWTQKPDAKTCLECTGLITDLLRNKGIINIYATPPPCIYYQGYEAGIEMALLSFNGTLKERQITSVVDLNSFKKRGMDSCQGRCRTAYKKAVKKGLAINKEPKMEDFYAILLENKSRRGALPTHSLEDLMLIKQRFPRELIINTAELDGKPIGGIAYFKANAQACLLFYVCHLTNFDQYNSPTLLIMDALGETTREGFRFFDLGTTCAQYNMQEKLSLFSFKESFGTYGVFRDTYIVTI